jgi:hypothetical protein
VNLLIGFLLAVVTTTNASKPTIEKVVPPTPEKQSIYLQSEVHDAIGALYVLKLQDALKESSRFTPATTPADARFVVGIVTMDPNEAQPEAGVGRSTAASVTLQMSSVTGLNPLLHSWVLVANRDQVDALVAELLTAIDQEITALE